MGVVVVVVVVVVVQMDRNMDMHMDTGVVAEFVGFAEFGVGRNMVLPLAKLAGNKWVVAVAGFVELAEFGLVEFAGFGMSVGFAGFPDPSLAVYDIV